MEKRYKYMDGYLIRDLLYQKLHPLRDAAFGADCLTSLKFENRNSRSKKMDSCNVIRNCYML